MKMFGDSAAAVDMGCTASSIKSMSPFDHVRPGGLRVRTS